MADVTDAAFRRIIARYGKPDVMWTEFVSADGLCSAGRKKLLHILKYDESERPIVAQIFSGNPEKIREASKLIQKLGFDGIDINMGCPDRKVEKSGGGASLIKNPKLAREIIRATKEGAPKLPVSVKTRIGYNKNELGTWLPEILAEEPAVVTIHARSRKEMSKVPARWEHVKEAVEIRNKMGSKTLIIGNGDVENLKDAFQKAQESGADGAMIGRAIFGNPWLFAGLKKVKDRWAPSARPLADGVHLSPPCKKLRILLEHAKLFQKILGEDKNFSVMKKHFKAYVSGFDGAKELRVRLMEAENVKEVEKIVYNFLNSKHEIRNPKQIPSALADPRRRKNSNI